MLPGIVSRHLSGHTPGHSGFRVKAAEQSLLVWGEAVLAAPFGFDVDAAAATREALLDEVARERSRVAGMHLDFPGVGHDPTPSASTSLSTRRV